MLTCLQQNSGLGCAGYEDFLLKVHEKLSTSDPSAMEAPVDVVPPDANAALEAAWAAEPPVADVEPVEPVEPVVDVAVQQQIATLELKVQEAMKRTARAQVQLRRKKAEELLLTGLMKHLKAACKVYQEREPEEHQDGEKKVHCWQYERFAILPAFLHAPGDIRIPNDSH